MSNNLKSFKIQYVYSNHFLFFLGGGEGVKYKQTTESLIQHMDKVDE